MYGRKQEHDGVYPETCCFIKEASCVWRYGAERCSADVSDRSCVSAAASDADDSAGVSRELSWGWAHTEEGAGEEVAPGGFEMTSLIVRWQGVEKCYVSS